MSLRYFWRCFPIILFDVSQEFDDSGDPDKHFEALMSLAKVGVEKGKVCFIFIAKISHI